MAYIQNSITASLSQATIYKGSHLSQCHVPFLATYAV